MESVTRITMCEPNKNNEQCQFEAARAERKHYQATFETCDHKLILSLPLRYELYHLKHSSTGDEGRKKTRNYY